MYSPSLSLAASLVWGVVPALCRHTNRDCRPSMVPPSRCGADEELFNAAFWTLMLASWLRNAPMMALPWYATCRCCTTAASRAVAVPAYLRMMVMNSCVVVNRASQASSDLRVLSDGVGERGSNAAQQSKSCARKDEGVQLHA